MRIIREGLTADVIQLDSHELCAAVAVGHNQAAGWRLDQPRPGVLVWPLPHGRSYTARPEPYPV